MFSKVQNFLAAMYAIATGVMECFMAPTYHGRQVEQPRGTAAVLNVLHTGDRVLMLIATHLGDQRLEPEQVARLFAEFKMNPQIDHEQQFGGVGTGRTISYYESPDKGVTFKGNENAGDFFTVMVAGQKFIFRLYRVGGAMMIQCFNGDKWKSVKVEGNLQHLFSQMLKRGERIFGSRQIGLKIDGQNSEQVTLFTSPDHHKGGSVTFMMGANGVVEAKLMCEFNTERTVFIGAGQNGTVGTVVTFKEEVRDGGMPNIQLVEIPVAVLANQLLDALTRPDNATTDGGKMRTANVAMA